MFSLLKTATRTVGRAAGTVVGAVVALPVAVFESSVNGGQETKVAQTLFNLGQGAGELLGEVAGKVVASVPGALVREFVHEGFAPSDGE